MILLFLSENTSDYNFSQYSINFQSIESCEIYIF